MKPIALFERRGTVATEARAKGQRHEEADPELVTICRREYAPLVGALGLYLNDRDEAEDIAQEALVRLCQRWAKHDLENPAGWLTRVAFNLATSHHRRTGSRNRALARLSAAPVLADQEPADAVAVRAALAKLPTRERLVLVLRYYADLPVSEVAAHLALPEGTVKTVTHRALAALRCDGFEVRDDD